MRWPAILLATLAVALSASAAGAAAVPCLIEEGQPREAFEPTGITPRASVRIAPGTQIALSATPPFDFDLPEGSLLRPIAAEVTVTRAGLPVLRRAAAADDVVYEIWTPPRPGRYVVRLASVYADEYGVSCEVAVVRTVDVFRRLVSRQVVLKRIVGMLTRYQKGIQQYDFRAAARTLDNRLGQLEALRFRSKVGTAALDRWIGETRRIEAFTDRLANRFEAGTLSQSLLAEVEPRFARWTVASERFFAVVRRLN